MSLVRKMILGTGLALGAVALAGSPLAGAAGPHIAANPTHVMVNSPVALRGSGFPPDTRITLAECSATAWVVPFSPCLTSNTVTVRTDSAGSFRTHMTARICPAVSPGVTPTQRTCYIGEPVPQGVDTISLVGAAKIVVSWP